MNIFIAFGIVSLFLYHEGKCVDFQRSDIDKSNKFIDDLIENTMAENSHKIEPYLPEDTSYGFERKVMLVTFSGEMLFKDMSISGITSIHRDGDSQLTEDNHSRKITCNLGMGVLELDSKVKLSFMKVGYTLTLEGKIGHVSVHVEASQEVNSDEAPKIDKLEIYDMKGMEVKLSGLGPINYMLNQLMEISLKVFKSKIRVKMEDKIKEVLEDSIQKAKFPEY